MAEHTLVELYKGRVKVKFYPVSHKYYVSVDGSAFKQKRGVTTIIGIKDKSRPLGKWQQRVTADFLLEAIAAGKKINEDLALEAVVQNEVLKEKAADIGTDIHAWCEEYITAKINGEKKIPDIPNFPEAVTGVNSFLEWEKKHKVKFVSTEQIRASLKYDYFGIEDVEIIADGKYCDADFKSSNGLYNGVRMQTAAYAMARMEDGGRKTQGRWAIRFSKYSEKEYKKQEKRKAELRAKIDMIRGKEPKEYPIKPYQVFEAKFLDDKKTYLQRDFEAFLHAKALFEWDRETDPFYAGEDW